MSSRVRFSDNNGLRMDSLSDHFVHRAEAGDMRGERMMGRKMRGSDCVFYFDCSLSCDICDEV